MRESRALGWVKLSNWILGVCAVCVFLCTPMTRGPFGLNRTVALLIALTVFTLGPVAAFLLFFLCRDRETKLVAVLLIVFYVAPWAVPLADRTIVPWLRGQ